MTDDIREYAEKKLNKLSKYLSNITVAHMELEEEKIKIEAELHFCPGNIKYQRFIIKR